MDNSQSSKVIEDLEKNPLKIVNLTQTGDSAADYLRVLLPLGTLGIMGLVDVRRFSWENLVDDPKTVNIMVPADVVYIRAMSDPRLLRFVERCKAIGKAVVMDIDDDLFHVNPSNPAYVALGTEEVYMDAPDGTKVPVWVDGHQMGDRVFSIEKNLANVDLIQNAVQKATLITTTTDRFAAYLKHLNPNVYVLPNSVDLGMWKTGRMPRPGYRIGWQGGDSHVMDLRMFAPHLIKFMKAHDDVRFVCCGWIPDPMVEDMKSAGVYDRLEFTHWQGITSYPWMMMTMGLDHGVAPLLDEKFNEMKSVIKWEEYGAMGVPCSASKVPPYSDEILHAHDGWLVDPDDWYEHLEFVYSHPEERQRVANNARKSVEERFSVSVVGAKYLGAFLRARQLALETKKENEVTVMPLSGLSLTPEA